MIIDPKMQRMFDQCRQHKRQLDKINRWLRAAMFLPPALIAAGIFLYYVIGVVFGLMYALGGTSTGGASIGPIGFFAAIFLAVFAAGETMLENKTLIENSHWFYPVGAGACFLITVLFRGEQVVCLMLMGYCIGAIFLNILFKKNYAENEMLKPLKGYPHFNILLMTEKDLAEQNVPDRKSPEEMTPDERLMYERDHNL